MRLTLSFPVGLALAVTASLFAFGCKSSKPNSLPCNNQCNASTETCVNNACVDNCSLCKTPDQACVNHACVANGCLGCSASQTCVNNACVAKCSLCTSAQKCVNDTCVAKCPTGQTMNNYGQCELSCEENEDVCGDTMLCIGGPQYISLLDTSSTPPTLNKASDNPGAYCAPMCPNGNECDSYSYCVKLGMYNAATGSNNRASPVCIRRDYCAPATSLADCYPTSNAAFFKDTAGNGFCTNSCTTVGDCPGDTRCVDGHCEPLSGTCAQAGQLCSSCLGLDSCPGYCYYSPLTQVRLCETHCVCTGQEATTVIINAGTQYQTSQGPMYGVYCTGASACPAQTPGGADAVCQTLAGVSTVSDGHGGYTTAYNYLPNAGLCAPKTTVIQGSPPSCYPPQP